MATLFPVWSHFDRAELNNLRRAAARLSPRLELCDEIPRRQDWFSIARRNIRRSDCVLLILTANSVSSPHCRKEISYAARMRKRTMIWTPVEPFSPAPDWARDAGWLSQHAIDARHAVAAILKNLHRSAR